jgi:type IV pilus assembly protein PilV
MRRQHGITMIEVLVTMVILAFGLLGIAVFQSKATVGSIESYQRAQAVILMDDMSNRLQGNPAESAGYVADNIGTGDARPSDCSAVAVGAMRDLCEWSNSLKGAAETEPGNKNVGAMIGARGCVTQVQAPDPTEGVCTPGIYQVSVVWQGLHATQAPAAAMTCGSGLYGAETYRRLIAVQVMIPLLECK